MIAKITLFLVPTTINSTDIQDIWPTKVLLRFG